MQTTKDLSKTRKFFYRWANMLLIFVALMYMSFIAIGVPVSLTRDFNMLMIVPRIDDHTLLKVLMSGYLALVTCMEWYMFNVIRRAYVRLKLYTVK